MCVPGALGSRVPEKDESAGQRGGSPARGLLPLLVSDAKTSRESPDFQNQDPAVLSLTPLRRTTKTNCLENSLGSNRCSLHRRVGAFALF